MNKHFLSSLTLLSFLIGGIFLGLIFSPRRTQTIEVKGAQNNKLSYTMALIEGMYVDSVAMDSLSEKIIPQLLEELDPHSVYIPLSEMADANETLEGGFDGIGIMFNMTTDTVLVMNVINAGPSDKAGLQNGDRIIKINDTLVAGVKTSQTDIMKKLRGKRGTEVHLQIERSAIDELIPVTIIRDKIPIKSLDAAFMVEDKIGFLKLSAFSRTSFSEIKQAMRSLRTQGMEKLIFDLRDNSGGFLDQAIKLTNEFLPAYNMIVYTKDRSGQELKEYSTGSGTSQDLDLVILINETSASSSEILAGAIQDNDRGTIIGRRSYGKGLVQQQIPYPDGSAIRLTIARYYTPTGRSIQKPYDKGSENYHNDIIERYKHQEFFSADSIHFADSLKFKTPKGKTVYGGGGIMPDIFIPYDTTGINRYYTEVTAKNILYKYTIRFSDEHRAELNEIKTTKQLENYFNDEKLLADFIAYASKMGVKENKSQIAEAKFLMTTQIKAYIGRNTPLEDVGFYAMIKPKDEIMLKAIEYLKQ